MKDKQLIQAFGHLIREKRTSKKLSQNDVADKLKVSRVVYTNMEMGHREIGYLLSRKLIEMFNIKEKEFYNLEKVLQRRKKFFSDRIQRIKLREKLKGLSK